MRNKIKNGKRVLAAVLAAALAAGSLAGCGGTGSVQSAVPTNAASKPSEEPGKEVTEAVKKDLLLAAANLPAGAVYPVFENFEKENGDYDEEGYEQANKAWTEDWNRRIELAVAHEKDFQSFLLDISKRMLEDPEVTNPAFSPLNIYFSLGMLAEIAEGETRRQVLEAAGAASLEDFYKTANALAQAVARSDEAQTVDLGSSLWLSDKLPFNEATVKQTAERYFASIYQGQFGTPEMDEALRGWLNEKTGGLLKDQIDGLSFDDPQLVLVLATTIYLKAAWEDKFREEDTENGIFYGKEKEAEVPFLHANERNVIYEGENFRALFRAFATGGGMYFLLPKEGVSPEELLSDEEARRFLSGGSKNWENSHSALVRTAIPKFDVTAEYDLVGIMKQMGIEDAFDVNSANFSSLVADGTPCYVSEAIHDARVKVDEEGVEAAAFTAYMLAMGALMESDEEDFILDRPFLFSIESDTGIPLFLGAVNQLGE